MYRKKLSVMLYVDAHAKNSVETQYFFHINCQLTQTGNERGCYLTWLGIWRYLAQSLTALYMSVAQQPCSFEGLKIDTSFQIFLSPMVFIISRLTDNIPIVEMNVVLKASSEKRKRRQVLPTPESPINKSLKSKSYVFFAMTWSWVNIYLKTI